MLHSKSIVSNIIYGVPSDHYDGTSSFYSASTCASGYYGGFSEYQTVTLDVSNFIGAIDIQASLNSDPSTASYFSVQSVPIISSNVAITDTFTTTVVGNFVLLRIAVSNFSSGIINSVSVTYQ